MRARIIDFNSEKTFLWVCLTPVIVFLGVVAVAPTTVAIIDSFRELSLISFGARGEFIGLENYRELISGDGKFYTAFWVVSRKWWKLVLARLRAG